MVFPAVTRPTERSASGVGCAATAAAAPRTRDAAMAAHDDARAAFEACLAEVRALEQGHLPLATHRWAARHRAIGEVRNTELMAYWWRNALMAALNVALVIAVVAVVSAHAVTAAAIAAVAALGVGLSVAWAVAVRAGTRRLAHWEARLEALDDEAPTGREPLSAGEQPARPSPGAGSCDAHRRLRPVLGGGGDRLRVGRPPRNRRDRARLTRSATVLTRLHAGRPARPTDRPDSRLMC